MGVIQNSFNQLLGITAAAGAVASKNFDEMKANKIEQQKIDLEDAKIGVKETQNKNYKESIDELKDKDYKAYVSSLQNYAEKVTSVGKQRQDLEVRREFLRMKKDQAKYGIFADVKNKEIDLQTKIAQGFKEYISGGNK